MDKQKELKPSSRLINSQEMARILGISRKTLLKWVAERKIPFLRVNRTLRFRPQDVVAISTTEQTINNNENARLLEGRSK